MDVGIKRYIGFSNRGFNLCFYTAISKIVEMEKSRSAEKIIIVAINLAILTAYTVYFKTSSTDSLTILLEAIAIGIHFITCLLLAIVVYRKEFLLSALVILLIGFSSCWIVFS